MNDVLGGHAALDIECLDRIYLNAYVPILQTSAQVVTFLSALAAFTRHVDDYANRARLPSAA